MTTLNYCSFHSFHSRDISYRCIIIIQSQLAIPNDQYPKNLSGTTSILGQQLNFCCENFINSLHFILDGEVSVIWSSGFDSIIGKIKGMAIFIRYTPKRISSGDYCRKVSLMS